MSNEYIQLQTGVPTVQATANSTSGQYLTFTAAGEILAMPIEPVREIIEFGGLTEIPLMPLFIRGVINLRGSVVPVIDLSARFERPASDIGKRSCIVIVEVHEADQLHIVGILVDSVSEVLDLPLDQIEEAPNFGTHIRTDFILGMGKVGGRFIVILSMNNILSIEEMSLLVATQKAREAQAAAQDAGLDPEN